ncbi:MAG: hypothetical protein QM703_23460 [Gemmatales bacterium]
MLADVHLKRVHKSKRRRLDDFFFLFYLPLNFFLIYWPIPFIFPYEPDIKDKHWFRWQETNGPEMWLVFHLLMAAVIGMVVYWSACKCYRPSHFLWLPVGLGIISLFLYWG